jgi:hypothetical protein
MITPAQIAACKTPYEIEVLSATALVGNLDARRALSVWHDAGTPTWLEYHPAPGRASRRHPPRTARKRGGYHA